MKIDKKELVPSYIRNLELYQSGKPIEELAREKGLKKISKLASNENPLGPSPLAIKEISSHLQNLHRYPDMHGVRLKESLGNLFNLKNKNIILGNGSEGIMSCIVRAFLGPNEEVLTSEATFIGFYILARSVGAKIKTVPLNMDFKFDIEKLASSVTENTKIIYISNPNNPTGTYITKSEFDFLMSKIPDHILVILDEAYFEFAKEYPDYPDSMDYRYDNVITLRTFSKAYGLSGIRIGYGFAHEDLINNITKVKLPFEPNMLAQVGAIGALHDIAHLENTLKNNSVRYKECVNYFNNFSVKYIPSAANFVTMRTGSLESSRWLYESLLNFGVIIRPLEKNDLPKFVRISLGTENEMQHFYDSMNVLKNDFLKQYREN